MIEKLTFGLFSKEDTKSFMRLMNYVKPYKARIIWALLAIVGVAATESYLAAFIAPLVNQGFAVPTAAPELSQATGIIATLQNWKAQFTHLIWGTENKVWIVPLFFISLIIIRGICRFTSTYLMTWVSVMAISHVRRDMFGKMLLLSSDFHQKNPSGTVLMNIVQMADSSINNASNVFITLTRDSMIVIGLVCVLLYLNWQLSLIVALMFPLLSLLSRYYRNRLKGIISSAQQSIGTLNNVVNETHQGHRVIKLFGGQPQAAERFAKVNGTLVRLGKKITQATAARSPISELIASGALAIVIFVALWQSQKGYTTIGEFMAFIVAMLQMLGPIKNLANISIPMQTMFLASDAVCGFLDEQPEKNTGTKTLGNITGRLQFEHVDVRYQEEHRKALDNFNLDIRAGEKVALVGRSGSGKTTAVNLLPRFVEPSAGKILIDGTDIADVELSNLRSQFALVSQDVFLFDDTLLENVRYSRPEASEEEVLAALKAANLQDLVANSPQGLHQHIGANGSQLSGGQRQRVSIARAILKDAPILLLDEATSALDNESERLVQQALERLMHGRTSIIVAHRLSTIEEADRIIVMDDGKIIEEGTHAELLAQNGYYAALSHIPKQEGK
ncbi:lipid A export permease/ATP-binding protein MsbA [Neisseria animalis]|uniref:Lipid A export permease/ATP-binding protein MsbA n=1 Tax=Neisseria animalis TaxID=492 RepID=A0A5P3MPN9_NEIAN|nr:lipid A export permease/ATP-binding protein MsbA [Neisseria animalis]QEY23506.1 lipid A export permease/ATP-binding protein MsbA [Neisseria animalis]ROW33352.1 lipid A export permease/ATP-binding protein MsbA [Neisseria animalis]VEE09096.1 putative ABC transporter ATP-binding protein [Neisseria animalis]